MFDIVCPVLRMFRIDTNEWIMPEVFQVLFDEPSSSIEWNATKVTQEAFNESNVEDTCQNPLDLSIKVGHFHLSKDLYVVPSV